MSCDNKQFFDPSDEKREEGVGHKAWEAMVTRIASLAKDDDSLLDAVADGEARARGEAPEARG